MMNVNECRIKELEQEITELKAHVERLRTAAYEGMVCEVHRDNKIICEALNQTPSQSLQEHDRRVILDCFQHFAAYLVDNHEDAFKGGENIIAQTSFWAMEDYMKANSLTNGDDND